MVSESGAGSASRRFHSGGGLQPFRFLAWMKSLAGVAGIEPANGDTKNRCLTTWLHPNAQADSPYSGVGHDVKGWHGVRVALEPHA